MVNFCAENDAFLYFFCLILHNEKSQENENNFFFSKKSLICGKLTILGARKTRGHNSGQVLRISFYFYIMGETKR